MPDNRSQDPDSDREKDDRDDLRGGKNKGATASSKAKDLSHVPCKFYRVGSCTAGASCPFSHSSTEPGAQKDVCAWFVKGNCKFAHKCALAHVLPGQSMAMDRKNKKAAQLAGGSGGGGSSSANNNGGAGPGGGAKERRSQRKDGPMTHNPSSSTSSNPQSSSRNAAHANPLLSSSGSTAPTRALTGSGSRPPITMQLKATISPSAPAPPLKDADFASFGIADGVDNKNNGSTNTLASPTNTSSVANDAKNNMNMTATGHGRMSSLQPDPLSSDDDLPRNEERAENQIAISPPTPLPVSTPTAPRRLGAPTARSPGGAGIGGTGIPDFGPIGSPPRSSPIRPSAQRVQGGFSPGTSPPSQSGLGGNSGNKVGNAYIPSSPFSAPGTSSVFIAYEKKGNTNEEAKNDFKMRSGLAASLGATRTWDNLANLGGGSSSSLGVGGFDVSLEEEDLEEFLPGSLTDLLTPEEKSRRVSRSHLSRPGFTSSRSGGGENSMHSQMHLSPPESMSSGGQYGGFSRSVPSQSLLGTIWSSTVGEAHTGLPGSPGMLGALGSGTPSSYKSASHGFGGRSFVDEGNPGNNGLGGTMSPSGSLLAPSNASAAFLPGMQAQYLSAKAQQQQSKKPGLGMGMRGVAGREGGGFVGSLGGGGLVGGIGGGGLNGAMSSPSLNAFANGLGGGPKNAGLNGGQRPPFEQTASDVYLSRPMLSQSSSSASNHTALADPNQLLDSHSHLHAHHQQNQHHHGIPAGNRNLHNQHLNGALSPSARALQAHAPGQSLPKGLGVGLSRIHVMPPVGSPGQAFSPPSQGVSAHQDWVTGGAGGGGNEGMHFGMIGPSAQFNPSTTTGNHSGGPGVGFNNNANSNNANTGNTGLDSMFSRLSYSAATSTPSQAKSANVNNGPPGIVPPAGMVRNVSGGRGYGVGPGPLSPLGGKVVTGADVDGTGVDVDDLFSMDG